MHSYFLLPIRADLVDRVLSDLKLRPERDLDESLYSRDPTTSVIYGYGYGSDTKPTTDRRDPTPALIFNRRLLEQPYYFYNPVAQFGVFDERSVPSPELGKIVSIDGLRALRRPISKLSEPVKSRLLDFSYDFALRFTGEVDQPDEQPGHEYLFFDDLDLTALRPVATIGFTPVQQKKLKLDPPADD